MCEDKQNRQNAEKSVGGRWRRGEEKGCKGNRGRSRGDACQRKRGESGRVARACGANSGREGSISGTEATAFSGSIGR